MKNTLWLIAAAFILGACAVTVSPELSPTLNQGPLTVGTMTGPISLRPYPGAVTYQREESDKKAMYVFETSADLMSVYFHFNVQLEMSGWELVTEDLDMRAEKVKSEYRFGGEELEFKLNREGKSERYKLEIKL